MATQVISSARRHSGHQQCTRLWQAWPTLQARAPAGLEGLGGDDWQHERSAELPPACVGQQQRAAAHAQRQHLQQRGQGNHLGRWPAGACRHGSGCTVQKPASGWHAAFDTQGRQAVQHGPPVVVKLGGGRRAPQSCYPGLDGRPGPICIAVTPQPTLTEHAAHAYELPQSEQAGVQAAGGLALSGTDRP